MSSTRGQSLAYGAAVSAAVLMGSLGMFVRNISADATVIAFSRLSLGFLFLFGFLGLTRNLHALKVSLSPYLVVSGLSIGLCVWAYIKAMTHTSLANAVFMLYLGPLLAVGLGHFMLKEKIALSSLLAMGLAFAGCLLVIQFHFNSSKADAVGYAYGLLSAFCYALIIVSNRKIPPQVLPMGRTFYQLLIAVLSFIPLSGWHQLHVPLQDLPWLLAVGFFQGFLGLTLMIFAIRHLKAYEYSIVSYLEPVTATLIGISIYAEPMSLFQAAGGCLIVSSGLVQIWLARTKRTALTRSI